MFRFSLLTDGVMLFRTFLRREFAEENLDFVLKVNQYRDCSPRKKPRMAWKIYKVQQLSKIILNLSPLKAQFPFYFQTYIAIGAPHEVNLDMLSRQSTDLAMITPHLSTFDAAQKRIINLLENGAYKRFLEWNIYKELVKEMEEEEEAQKGNCEETALQETHKHDKIMLIRKICLGVQKKHK